MLRTTVGREISILCHSKYWCSCVAVVSSFIFMSASTYQDHYTRSTICLIQVTCRFSSVQGRTYNLLMFQYLLVANIEQFQKTIVPCSLAQQCIVVHTAIGMPFVSANTASYIRTNLQLLLKTPPRRSNN